MKKPILKIETVMGISNARYTMPDNSGIDMVVKTDAGDFPFHYIKDDDAPLAELVKAYLSSKPDLKIAAYQPRKLPPPPEPKKESKPKGDSHD
jgi:hypothetical protein